MLHLSFHADSNQPLNPKDIINCDDEEDCVVGNGFGDGNGSGDGDINSYVPGNNVHENNVSRRINVNDGDDDIGFDEETVSGNVTDNGWWRWDNDTQGWIKSN